MYLLQNSKYLWFLSSKRKTTFYYSDYALGMAKDLRNYVVIWTVSSCEVEKLSAKGINLFSLVNNLQQTIYYTALYKQFIIKAHYDSAFETFMTEILVIIIAPPVNLFISGLTLWPWQAANHRNSSAHQFLREILWWHISICQHCLSLIYHALPQHYAKYCTFHANNWGTYFDRTGTADF